VFVTGDLPKIWNNIAIFIDEWQRVRKMIGGEET
jgi:hypothetical protein